MRTALLVVATLLTAGLGYATTWVIAERADPITGDKVKVSDIMSYGGYIYQWPSKFDLVFWPFTDENWIWFCPRSGYAAFGSDFEKLSAPEKERLQAWLKTNYDASKPPRGHFEKLAWLEKVYTARQMDEDFWRHFYRVAAYVLREDTNASLAYVRKALVLIDKHLAGNPSGMALIESLYLKGEYSRRLGEIGTARECFEKVKSAKYTEDGAGKAGHPYFLALVKDREALLEGKTGVNPQ